MRVPPDPHTLSLRVHLGTVKRSIFWEQDDSIPCKSFRAGLNIRKGSLSRSVRKGNRTKTMMIFLLGAPVLEPSVLGGWMDRGREGWRGLLIELDVSL